MSGDERFNVLDTLAKYCQYSADRRYEDWASLFAEDGRLIGIDGVPRIGRRALAEHLPTARPQGTVKTLNFNPIIEIDGDRATVVSDWVLVRVSDNSRVILAGRYNDELQKEPSGWKFLVRHMIYAEGSGDNIEAIRKATT